MKAAEFKDAVEKFYQDNKGLLRIAYVDVIVVDEYILRVVYRRIDYIREYRVTIDTLGKKIHKREFSRFTYVPLEHCELEFFDRRGFDLFEDYGDAVNQDISDWWE